MCQVMTHRSRFQPHYSDLLLEKGGLDLRAAKDTWRKLAESEARLHLMVELGHLEVGFPDVENFCLDLEGKYRSRVTGELRDKGKKSQEWKIVKLCMSLKMIDERQVHSELETERYILKKAIEDVLGKNTKKATGEEHQEGKKPSEEDQTGSCKSKVNNDDEA